MPSTPPKVKDLLLTPEIRALGISRIYIIARTLILTLESGSKIQSHYYSDDLVKTTKYLRNTLAGSNKVNGLDTEKLIIFLSELFLDAAEAEAVRSQSQLQEEHREKSSIVEEIKHARELSKDITLEQWRNKLQEKYQKLYNLVQKYMPEIWPGLEFELSILRILNIEGCTLPLIGIILGRPSSGKTVIIDLLRKWYCSFYTDNFTARSFVSHSTAVSSKEELQEIDLLPKIKNKMFLTPELSPTFTAKDDDLTQLLGIITRIADGHGFVSDSGAHGHRGYDENIMFVWVGAAVDVPYKVYKVLGNLGAKLYFFRMSFEDKTDNELLTDITTDQDFNNKFKQVQNTLFEYLLCFEICPDIIIPETNAYLPKIKWDRSKDDVNALRYVVRLARLLSHLRCVAKTWETEDSQGSDYAYSVSLPEDPSRAITVLSNLARGHALLAGRNYINLEDIPIVIKTVLSTAQTERVSLFTLLISNQGKLTTNEILESLNISKPTALRTMAELKAIGLVELSDHKDQGHEGRPAKQITLKPQFSWFLSDELIKKNAPHIYDNFTQDTGNGHAKREDIFWKVYDGLESEELNDRSNFLEADKNTVNGKKLQERLIATGEFHNGDAELMLQNMVKAGKLELVMLDTYRRVRKQ